MRNDVNKANEETTPPPEKKAPAALKLDHDHADLTLAEIASLPEDVRSMLRLGDNVTFDNHVLTAIRQNKGAATINKMLVIMLGNGVSVEKRTDIQNAINRLRRSGDVYQTTTKGLFTTNKELAAPPDEQQQELPVET